MRGVALQVAGWLHARRRDADAAGWLQARWLVLVGMGLIAARQMRTGRARIGGRSEPCQIVPPAFGGPVADAIGDGLDGRMEGQMRRPLSGAGLGAV